MSTVTAERVAAFARTLPERSAIFVSIGDAPAAIEGVTRAGREIDVLADPAMPAGNVLGKSWYAISVGDIGWWMDDPPD